MPDDPVTIARFPNGSEAHHAKIELEEAGIACMLADEGTSTLLWPSVVGGVKLQVNEADVDRAIAVLAQTPAAQCLVVSIEGEAEGDA